MISRLCGAKHLNIYAEILVLARVKYRPSSPPTYQKWKSELLIEYFDFESSKDFYPLPHPDPMKMKKWTSHGELRDFWFEYRFYPSRFSAAPVSCCVCLSPSKKVWKSKQMDQKGRSPVADPGFSRGALGRDGRANLLSEEMFAKNCLKIKDFGPKGVPFNSPKDTSSNVSSLL